jgi:hypothetical protein
MVKSPRVKKMKAKIPLSPEEAAKLNADRTFRRLTGVWPETFKKMIEILEAAHMQKKSKGGRPNKLSMEMMLRMALEYWREYRTCFHIGKSYGLSESNAYQTIKWIENIIIKDGAFSLPGKKALLDENAEYEVILPDATETPIERPKRGRKSITQARKNVTH